MIALIRMTGGLGSGNFNAEAEKEEVSPKGEDEVNDNEQKFSDLDFEVRPRTNTDSDSVKEDIKIEESNASEKGKSVEDRLNVNGGKRNGVDGEADGGYGVVKSRAKEDDEVQNVGRVLRPRFVVNSGSEKEANEAEIEEENRNGGSIASERERVVNMQVKVKKKVKGKRGRPPKVRERDEYGDDEVRKKVKGKRGRPRKVRERDEYGDCEVRKKVKGKRGRPPKVWERDEYGDDEVRKKVKSKRGRPPKVQEIDEPDDEVMKKVKRKRGRPPKVQEIDESDDEVRKKVKGKRGRPPKVREIDQCDDDEVTKNVKGKRGRPPKVQDSDEARKKVKFKRGRPPKGQASGETERERRDKLEVKCKTPSMVQETDKANGEGNTEVTDKCSGPQDNAQDIDGAEVEGNKRFKCKRGRPPKDESDEAVSKRMKDRRGRPLKVQGSNTVLRPKFGKVKKVNGFRKSGRAAGFRDTRKELNGKRFVLTTKTEYGDMETDDTEASSRLTSDTLRLLKFDGQTENKSVNAKQEESLKKNKAKQLIRDRIVELLFAAGWTIDYRPRQGREYKDAVYVNPIGQTHWSVTKAYMSLKGFYEEGGNNSGASRNGFIFTPIPEEELKILQKKNQKTRSDKNKKKSKKKTKNLDTDDLITKKKKNKQKLHGGGMNSAGSVGGKSKKRGIKVKSSVCEQNNLVGASHKGTLIAVRKHKQQETQNRKRCALLARSTVHGAESDAGDYVLYEGKRTVLAWMIDLGTVQLNGKVQYSNRRKTGEMLKGKITRDGIHCDCCGEIFTIPKFETHAGSNICHPFQNLYLESGSSLLQCILDSWNKQEECKRKGFHFVNFGGEDPNDDTCGICGDGGDLICCDGCPSTFHQSCLEIKRFPSGNWHCVYCSCKFCGKVDENTCSIDGNNDTVISALQICSLCEEKYHQSCSQAEDAVIDDPNSLSFCGKKCQKIFERLQTLLGVKYELEDGYMCTIIHRSDVGSDLSLTDVSRKVECNAKLAVALFVMDECFVPLADHRSGVNLIHNIVYNFGSNFKRLNYSGFLTAILEKDDEIISAASIRIHGSHLAEMPFIGTRYVYRRQGMCRRLLNGIESALCFLHVEKLVIPAISEVRETWTSVFGFKPLEVPIKQKMKNMNLLVFPGVDMLQKPMLKHHFLEEKMIPAKGLKSDELTELETMDEVAKISDGICSDGIDLNVCIEDTEGHEFKMRDESVKESSLQHPDGSSNDASGMMTESLNFQELTELETMDEVAKNSDGICADGIDLNVCIEDTEGHVGKMHDESVKESSLQGPDGSSNDASGIDSLNFPELKELETMVAKNSKCLCSDGIDLNVCIEDTGGHVFKMHDESVKESSLQHPEESSNDASGIMTESLNFQESTNDCISQLGVTNDDMEGNDKALRNTLGSASDTDGQTEDMSNFVGQFPHGSMLGTKCSASEVKMKNIIAKHEQSCNEARANESSEINTSEHQNVDILLELEVSRANIINRDSKATDQTSNDAKVFIDFSTASADIYGASTASSSTDCLPKTGNIYRSSVHQTSPSSSKKVQNLANCCDRISDCKVSSCPGNGLDAHEVVVCSTVDMICYPSNGVLSDAAKQTDFQPCMNSGICLPADVMTVCCKANVDGGPDLKEKLISVDKNPIPDGFQMNTESSKHLGSDSEIVHASVAHCNSESLCNLTSGSGVALHCASGGGNSCGTSEP